MHQLTTFVISFRRFKSAIATTVFGLGQLLTWNNGPQSRSSGGAMTQELTFSVSCIALRRMRCCMMPLAARAYK